tara:strand:+ start:143 stop:1156 length:1014 start_codon:yes stop_codon:yes gene_type:complete
MINSTIAFDNKKRVWKTRYSFLSNCFAYLDRMFFSSPKNNDSSVGTIWSHGPGADTNNNFYGQPYQSSIAVTFNAHSSTRPGQASPKVSSNKIYKSFSLEGTTNMSGENMFLVNNSSQPSQLQVTDIGELEEKGGILYGHIGQERKVTGTNVKVLGEIISVDSANNVPNLLVDNDGSSFVYNVEGKELLAIEVNIVAGFLPTSSGTKLFKSIDQLLYPCYLNEGAEFENINFATEVPFENYMSFGDLWSDSALGITSYKNGYFLVEKDSNNPLHKTYEESSQTEYLYAISPSSENGASPKGQYADAVVNLGSDNFELFALNVEFETTDYSHSGEVKK